MRALAIETSCDDTAVAIVELDETGTATRVRAHLLSSQIALHAVWGGVVPNLAAREHGRNIQPLLEALFAEAKLEPTDIDLVAVTAGPGLIPALAVGVQTAKTLAYRWHKPLLGIHHIEGHIYANFIRNDQSPHANFQKNPNDQAFISKKSDGVPFPLLALVVSGGHTQLVLMRDHFTYEILGETQDDAVGEAFDKVAKMLGLSYPGGPIVAKHAQAWESRMKNQELSENTNLKSQHDFSITLPRPMIHSGDFNFSFSGIKTAVLYALQKQSAETLADEHFINAVCHEFQTAAVDVLVAKTKQAIKQYAPKTVVIAGGVSANIHLRQEIGSLIAREFPETTFRMPEFACSLDNAAMIGSAALLRWYRLSETQKNQASTNWQTLDPDSNLKLHGLA